MERLSDDVVASSYSTGVPPVARVSWSAFGNPRSPF
jgi:hypothetical protein